MNMIGPSSTIMKKRDSIVSLSLLVHLKETITTKGNWEFGFGLQPRVEEHWPYLETGCQGSSEDLKALWGRKWAQGAGSELRKWSHRGGSDLISDLSSRTQSSWRQPQEEVTSSLDQSMYLIMTISVYAVREQSLTPKTQNPLFWVKTLWLILTHGSAPQSWLRLIVIPNHLKMVNPGSYCP